MTILDCSVTFAVFARFRSRVPYRAILLDRSRVAAVASVEALSSLIADRDAAARMGATGRGVAEARYSVATLAPRLAELLRRLG